MMAVTQGMIESELNKFAKQFNTNFDGKTIGECHDICLKKCPNLHTRSELDTLKEQLLTDIKNEFGFLGVRLFVECKCTIFGNEVLSSKYFLLLKDISDFVENWRIEHELIYTLDVLLMSWGMYNKFNKMFGNFSEDNEMVNDLYCLLKTIKVMHYDKNIIQALKNDIYIRLEFLNAQYYLNNFDNIETLKELYTHLSEIMGDKSVYRGHDLFHNYDGYGGINFSI